MTLRLAAITPSRWLMISVIALDVLLVVSAFVGGHYFGIDVASTLAYPPGDGHCNAATEGIGNHCFSDYYIFSSLVHEPNPWVNEQDEFVNYLAAGLLPHWLFSGIGQLFGSARLGLILYLAAMTAAVVTPAVWATWRKPLEHKVIAISLLGILSVPALAAIDRGNTIGFVVPGLLFFIVGLARNHTLMIALSVAAATLVKPQYAVLLVAVVALRKWKAAGWSLGAIAITNALPYLLWPASFPATLRDSVQNALTFGGTYIGSITAERAQTVSFARGVLVVEELLNGWWGSGTTTSPMISVAVAGGLLIAVTLLVLLLITGRSLPPALLASFAIAIPSMALTTSYSYYTVFALPIAAVMLTDPGAARGDGRRYGILDRLPRALPLRIASGLIVATLALTVTRVMTPVVSTLPSQLVTSTSLIPILWAATIVVACVLFAVHHRRARSDAAAFSPEPLPSA